MLKQRVVAITVGLALAGGLTGALSGGLALSIAVVALLRVAPPFDLVAPASAIGAAFGLVVAPTLAWTALRSIPLGRAIAGIAFGAGIGGSIGVLLGASAVNPYAPLTLMVAPVPQGLAGALVGSLLAAAWLRFRYNKIGVSHATV